MVLNSRFIKILEVFRVDLVKDFLVVLKKQVVATFNQMTNSKEESFKELQLQHKDINIKINRLEERYIEEEVGLTFIRSLEINITKKKLKLRGI